MDHISDNELVKRLKEEFDFKCGPITMTTRNLYVKKLEKFINEKKINDSPSRRRRTIATPLTIDVDSSLNIDKQAIGLRHSPRNRRSLAIIPAAVNTANKHVNEDLDVTASKSPRRRKVNGESKISNAATANISDLNNRNTHSQPLSAYSSAESSGDEEQPANIQSSSPNLLTSYIIGRKSVSSPKSKETSPSPSNYRTSMLSSFSELRHRSSNTVPLPRVHSKPSSTRNSRIRSLNTNTNLSNSSNLVNFSDSETDGDNQLFDDNKSIKSLTDHFMKYRQILPKSKYSLRNSYKTAINGQHSYNDDDDDDEDDDNTGPYNVIETKQPSNDLQTTISSSSSKWIPITIIGLLCFFFVTIISFYLYSCLTFQFFGRDMNLVYNLGEDFNILTINKTLCQDPPIDVSCIKESVLPHALLNAKLLHDIVKENLVNHLCETPFTVVNVRSNPYEYTIDEIRNIIKMNSITIDLKTVYDIEISNKPTRDDLFLKFVNDIFHLIEQNPNWHMCIKDRFEVHTDILDKLSLSFNCRLYRIMLKLLTFFAASLIVILPVCLIYFYLSHRNRKAKEEKELIFEYVEKAIELLQSPDNPQSIPIMHVRDMLFTAQDMQSKKLRNIWQKVLKYIEANESRVKVNLENIHGEDFQTWRWIGPKKIISKSNENDSCGNDTDDGASSTVMKTGKFEWQGQAFTAGECERKTSTKLNNSNTKAADACVDGDSNLSDTQKVKGNENLSTSIAKNGTETKNFIAPTAYLKVRNIFNNEQQSVGNWKADIANAIIEKCVTASTNGKHGILHISVDDKNLADGIVYIKCDSIESATKAFHALHGWWCERKLVSVRFLKEERYYARFPDARFMTVPLTRSN